MSNPERLTEAAAYARALSADQIKAMEARYRQTLQKTLDDMELRKVALELAAKVYQQQLTSNLVSPSDPIALARAMYDFLLEPAAKIEIT